MEYKYSVDDKLYDNEIRHFIKSSLILKKIRTKTIFYSLLIVTIATITLLIKSVIENKYDRDFIYIFLEYIIIYIAVVVVILVFTNFYFKFKVRKTLLKYWKKDYVHKLESKDEKIYYSGFNNKKLELNNVILGEVRDLGNIWAILTISQKNLCSMIIIHKDIFKSKEELSEFKNLLENKLKK